MKGNFKWNEDKTKVVFEEDNTGIWDVYQKSLQNTFEYSYSVGIDPYSFKLKWYQRLLNKLGLKIKGKRTIK